MREVYQVVILLDIDLVSEFESDDNAFKLRVNCLRRTILNVLTVFSIQHSDLLNQNSNPHFRWGCKFYCSTQKKRVSQKFQFLDFNLEVYEKFEKELEEQCKTRRLELLNNKDTDASQRNGHADILSITLKDVLCDYSWNELSIDSPVGACNSLQRRRLKAGNGLQKSQSDEDSTKNFVVVISSVPKSEEDLRSFFGKDDIEAFEPDTFLRSILPDSVKHQFYIVSRISLLWLDLTLKEPRDTITKNSCPLDYPKLIDKALKIVGGGLIPLNSSLMFLLSNCDKLSNCCCSKRSFPKEMEYCLPLSSAMSGFLSKERELGRRINHLPSHSVLHLDGVVTYDLELLPLFGKNSRQALKRDENYGDLFTTAALNGQGNEKTWFPKELHTIGTISIHDVHHQLIARPFLFICNGINSKTDSASSFHHLLIELVNQQQALLLSCDYLCQGILFPANSRAKVAMLYILSDGETVSSITSKLGEFCASPSAETKDFIHHYLNDWDPPKPNLSEMKSNAKDHCEDPISFNKISEKWLSVSESYKSDICNTTEIERNTEQINLDNKLQQVYKSEISTERSKGIDKVQSVKGLNSDKVAVGGSELGNLAPEKDFQASFIENMNKKRQMCEEDLVDKLNSMYDEVIVNGEFLKCTHDMVIMVLDYYNEFNSNDCPNLMAEKLICQYFLVTPETVAKRHSDSDSRTKKTRVNEHFMQAVLRLELLVVVSPALTVEANEITAHLRMVLFAAGIEELTTFLQSIVVKNYYHKVKEVVTLVCRDLNQPVHQGSSQTGSETDQASSPDKLQCVLMEIPDSPPSSVSSLSSQTRLRREVRFGRNANFSSLKSSRQIFVPADKLHPKKNGDKQMVNKKETKRNVTKLSNKKQEPTTPNGRHVLKTKTAKESPICKQVDDAVLKRQSLKRKRTDDDDDMLTVDETPDKSIDWSKRFFVRRSPRAHPCTVARDSGELKLSEKPKGSEKSIGFEKNMQGSGKETAQDSEAVKNCVSAITPERKAKVRRHLDLSEVFSCSEKDANKLVSQNTLLLYDLESNTSSEVTFARTLRSNSKRGSQPFINFDEFVSKSTTASKTNRDQDLFVLGEVLQTPPKNEETNTKFTDTISDSPVVDDDQDTNVIASTPTRNGLDSPVTLLEDLCLLYGSLTNGLEETLSRSSSPRIPLLFEEDGSIIGDCGMKQMENCQKSTTQLNSSDFTDLQSRINAKRNLLNLEDPVTDPIAKSHLTEASKMAHSTSEIRNSDKYDDNSNLKCSRAPGAKINTAHKKELNVKITKANAVKVDSQKKAATTKIKESDNLKNRAKTITRDFSCSSISMKKKSPIATASKLSAEKSKKSSEELLQRSSKLCVQLTLPPKSILKPEFRPQLNSKEERESTESPIPSNSKSKEALINRELRMLDTSIIINSLNESHRFTRSSKVEVDKCQNPSKKCKTPNVDTNSKQRVTRNASKNLCQVSKRTRADRIKVTNKQDTSVEKIDSDDSSLHSVISESDSDSKPKKQSSEVVNKSELNGLLSEAVDPTPQRFTRAASKEIGLTLDAFTKISTIPSTVPIKAVEVLTRRYGTLPSETSSGSQGPSRKKPCFRLKDSKVLLTSSSILSKYQLTRRSRIRALVKNSTKMLRKLRSSTSNLKTVATRSKLFPESDLADQKLTHSHSSYKFRSRSMVKNSTKSLRKLRSST